MYSKSPMHEPSSCKLFQDVNIRSISMRHELSDVVPSCCHDVVPSASGQLQLVLCLLLLTILQPYHLPPPLPLLVSDSSCLFTQCQAPSASCCTIVLIKVLYLKIKNVSLFVSVFLRTICLKSIINLLQDSMSNCS